MVSMQDMTTARTRINSATLSKLTGRPVILLGTVEQVDSSRQKVQVQASDGQMVVVKFQEPLQENLSGIVEFHGIAEGKQMLAEFYINFPSDYTVKFDMTTYDQAVKLIHSVENNAWYFD